MRFKEKPMQPARKILAFASQSALSFVVVATMGILGHLPPFAVTIAFILWSLCVGVAIVPETPKEIRAIKNYLDKMYPWV